MDSVWYNMMWCVIFENLCVYNMIKCNVIVCHIRKNVIVDFYISCNATVTDKYVLTYISNISRINIESWTTYWDLWLKWYILHDSSLLKHYKMLTLILIQ